MAKLMVPASVAKLANVAPARNDSKKEIKAKKEDVDVKATIQSMKHKLKKFEEFSKKLDDPDMEKVKAAWKEVKFLLGSMQFTLTALDHAASSVYLTNKRKRDKK